MNNVIKRVEMHLTRKKQKKLNQQLNFYSWGNYDPLNYE